MTFAQELTYSNHLRQMEIDYAASRKSWLQQQSVLQKQKAYERKLQIRTEFPRVLNDFFSRLGELKTSQDAYFDLISWVIGRRFFPWDREYREFPEELQRRQVKMEQLDLPASQAVLAMYSTLEDIALTFGGDVRVRVSEVYVRIAEKQIFDELGLLARQDPKTTEFIENNPKLKKELGIKFSNEVLWVRTNARGKQFDPDYLRTDTNSTFHAIRELKDAMDKEILSDEATLQLSESP